MEYNQLGRTGLQVSRIGFGAMHLGKMEKSTAFAILDKAHDLGMNLIDTASGYQNSEKVIGNWMTQSGNREEILINSKVGFPVGEGKFDRGLSRLHVMKQLKRTLSDLQTDYVDIYQAHYYDGHEDLIGLVRLFHDLTVQEHIRSIGAPLFMRPYNIVAWHFLALQYGLNNISSKLMTTSLLSRGMYNGNTKHIAKDYNIGLITFAALGGGLLTGKYHSKEPYPENGREMFKKSVSSGKIDPLVDLLRNLADEKETTPAKLSFAWVLHHDFMDSVVIGANSPEQLEDIFSARDLKLTDDEFNQLTEMSDKCSLW